MISLVITLIIIGVLMWLMDTYVPMDRQIKNIIHIVVIICVVLYLLSVFGVFHHADVPVPQIN